MSFTLKGTAALIAVLALPTSIAAPVADAGAIGKETPFQLIPSSFHKVDGVKIGDDCESRLPGGAHCWTDYVLVDHHASSVGPWYSPVGQISCPADTNSHISSCNQQIGNLKQDADTCKNTLWNAGGKVGANIKTEINKIIGISFSAEASGSLGGSAVAYSTNTTIDACQWSGGSGCHQSWASQVIVSIRGFKCRTCATPSSDPNVNMPNMPVRASDNLYTCDMQDFQIDLASATTVDYDGGCIYQNTNPLPNIDPNPTPWPVSVA